MSIYHLSLWDKALIVLCSLGAVGITAFLVVCIVAPFCPMHKLLPRKSRINNKYSPSDALNKNIKHAPIPTVELTKVKPTDVQQNNNYYWYDGAKFESDSSFAFAKLATEQARSLSLKAKHSLSGKSIQTFTKQADSTYGSLTISSDATSIRSIKSRPSSPTSYRSDSIGVSMGSGRTSDMMSQPGGTMSNAVSPVSSSAVQSPSENQQLLTLGHVTVTLSYEPVTDSKTFVRLTICLREAEDLPQREYNSSGDPYATIEVFKNHHSLRLGRPPTPITLNKFTTDVIKKSRHPMFNQTFNLEMTKAEFKESNLKITLLDRDRFVNPTKLGEISLSLKKLKLPDTGEMVSFTKELGDPIHNCGEMQIGITYLATSERLLFNGLKATNVRTFGASMDSLNYVYVRILLLHQGKLITRRKSGLQSSSSSPEFNDTLTFDLPADHINQVCFIVALTHKESPVSSPDENPDSPDPSIAGDISPTQQNNPALFGHRRQEKYIGKVILGNKCRLPALQHWQDMLKTPRQTVLRWHNLR